DGEEQLRVLVAAGGVVDPAQILGSVERVPDERGLLWCGHGLPPSFRGVVVSPAVTSTPDRRGRSAGDVGHASHPRRDRHGKSRETRRNQRAPGSTCTWPLVVPFGASRWRDVRHVRRTTFLRALTGSKGEPRERFPRV